MYEDSFALSNTPVWSLLHKFPKADLTGSHRGGWDVGNNLKRSLNCLCCRVADCVCVAVHRGSPLCLTRCSPLTPHRFKSTTPAPSRLSKVSCMNGVSDLKAERPLKWIYPSVPHASFVSLRSIHRLHVLTASYKKCENQFLWHDAVTRPTGMSIGLHRLTTVHAYHSTAGPAYPEVPTSNQTEPQLNYFFHPSLRLPLFYPD